MRVRKTTSPEFETMKKRIDDLVDSLPEMPISDRMKTVDYALGTLHGYKDKIRKNQGYTYDVGTTPTGGRIFVMHPDPKAVEELNKSIRAKMHRSRSYRSDVL